MIELDLREWANPDKGMVTRMKFPDGQPHVSLRYPLIPYRIVTAIKSSDDLLELGMVSEILRRRGNDWNLYITYLMGGRLDRPIDANSPFTLKVVTDIINTYGQKSVTLLDPHSDVSTALLNSRVISNLELVRAAKHWLTANDKLVTLIAPDAGASKKVAIIAEELGLEYVQALKHRNSEDGKLSNFEIVGEIPKDHVGLIVDDICDGGGTFVGLARQIPDRDIYLAVTHGIFSKGTNIPGIKKIWTTDSYQRVEAMNVEVIPALNI